MEDRKVVLHHDEIVYVNEISASLPTIYDGTSYLVVPKEVFILSEELLPGTKTSFQLGVTIVAGTTTSSSEKTVASGYVWYLENFAITVPNGVTGEISIDADGIALYVNRNLVSETINIVNEFGRRIRCSKIKVTVTLDAAQSSDKTIEVSASVIQRKALL